jgi:hypothetical protein
MKKIFLFGLLTLALNPVCSFASGTVDTTFRCYNTSTNNPIAKVVLAIGSNAATIHLNQTFQGTYQVQNGQCPSRLCGSLTLNLRTFLSNVPYGGTHMIIGYFTYNNGTSELIGNFDLYDVGGRAPEHIKAYCQLQP